MRMRRVVIVLWALICMFMGACGERKCVGWNCRTEGPRVQPVRQ